VAEKQGKHCASVKTCSEGVEKRQHFNTKTKISLEVFKYMKHEIEGPTAEVN
jgi:hypothetical protein